MDKKENFMAGTGQPNPDGQPTPVNDDSSESGLIDTVLDGVSEFVSVDTVAEVAGAALEKAGEAAGAVGEAVGGAAEAVGGAISGLIKGIFD